VGETPGTGLGMVIVKHCVQLHHGKIAFESRESQGTTFAVGLPLFGPVPGNGEGTAQFLRATATSINPTIIS
jgi:nitrogen-specific signal transduction histidine kinase